LTGVRFEAADADWSGGSGDLVLLNGVVVIKIMATLNATFEAANKETSPGTVAPATPFRSAGPGSLVTWNSLGHDGRNFVTDGPTVDQLSRFSGRPAIQPIRAYAGLASADGVQAEANLMVRELDQAGSLNEKSATALEYLANGNSALVSVQYSYLPSSLSFLSDHTRAERAGKALFNAVYDKWKTLPPTYRPKLVILGESLGSFGSESAFSGPSDMQARTDGVVFTGPPSMIEVWSELESARDPGSPQWLPVYQQGRVVRFMARAADLNDRASDWAAPRRLSATPVGPDRLVLAESAVQATGLAKGTTGLRRAAGDPLVSDRVLPAARGGHGRQHRCAGWARPLLRCGLRQRGAAILQPPGWTTGDTERLRALLIELDTAPESTPLPETPQSRPLPTAACLAGNPGQT